MLFSWEWLQFPGWTSDFRQTSRFVSGPDGVGCECLPSHPLQVAPKLPQRLDHGLRVDGGLRGKAPRHILSLCRQAALVPSPSASSVPFQISSSNDGRLCLWDLEAAQCLREIPWGSPLSSLCCVVSRSYSHRLDFTTLLLQSPLKTRIKH